MSNEWVEYNEFNFPLEDIQEEVEKVEEEKAEEVYESNKD